ncbi:MAG TPA: DUF5063 domain-containing protein [Anaerolineales bacterium]|nr:DUF5063 domain-containing protein [Anaerolineales bacterium]
MDRNLEQFISLSREYISMIDNLSDKTMPHEFLSKCIVLLPQIYALGFQLPNIEPENSDVSKPDFSSPMSSITKVLGKYDFYNEVFDPIFDEDIVTSSISDDLADIYKDLKDPLINYDCGKKNDAIWSWRFNILGHCGDHIVDALRAIHRLVNDHMPMDYNANENGG